MSVCVHLKELRNPNPRGRQASGHRRCMLAAGRAVMASNGQYVGVTPPISAAGPTEVDVIKTKELEKVRARVCLTYSKHGLRCVCGACVVLEASCCVSAGLWLVVVCVFSAAWSRVFVLFFWLWECGRVGILLGSCGVEDVACWTCGSVG